MNTYVMTMLTDAYNASANYSTNDSLVTTPAETGGNGDDGGWIVTDYFYFIFSAMGILANTAFIVVYFNIKALQTFTNLYLLHLAMADLLYLIMVFFIRFIKLVVSIETLIQLFGSPEGCRGTYLFGGTMQFSSVFIIALVCVERYLAICSPLRSLQRNTKLRSYIQLSIAWLVGILFALPGTIVFCGGYASNSLNIVTLTLESLPYIASVGITMVLYSLISIKLMTRDPGSFELGKERRKENREVVLLLVTTTIAFFVLIVPHRVTNFLDLIIHVQGKTSPNYLGTVFESFNILVILNSAVNAFIYNITSNMFRRSFKAVFCCGEEPIRRSDTTKYRYTSRSQTSHTQLTPYGTPSPGNTRKFRVNSFGQQNKLSTGEPFEMTPRTTPTSPAGVNGNQNNSTTQQLNGGSGITSPSTESEREVNEMTAIINDQLDTYA